MRDAHTIGDYVCLERLGAGGQATTWLAEPADGGDEVLLKVFHVEVAEDWKAAELFERAAQVLEGIDHPNIPAYHDHFEVESDGVVRLCLARDFVAGDSLQDRIDEDGSLSEPEVVELAIELLEVLQYLHAKDPPIVHRDIKPANVILGEDGRPYLVDFGAVQADVLTETGGSTVVGTAGYVAPEQLMGRAEPSSDIYALGVTLVHLLTHTPPTELPSEGFELRFDELLEASAGLKYIIGRMVRADIDEREASAEGLLEKFRTLRDGGQIAVRSSTLPVVPPRGSTLEVVEDEYSVSAQSPTPVLFWHHKKLVRVLRLSVYAVLFVTLLTPLAFLFASIPLLMIGLIGGVIGVLFWAVSLQRRLKVEMTPKYLNIQLPPIRPRPGSQYDSGTELSYYDEYRGETQIPWAHVSIHYGDIRSVDVVRRPSWSSSIGIWKLRLDVDYAERSQRFMGFLDSDDLLQGKLIFELNLTHGEYLWLARLIDKRVSQYRELEG
ncbi:MAG: serine/threonine protein kinase [Myxococcota bacterium]